MNNLDKILKEQMSNFAPDAPNVWAGVEQGVQVNTTLNAAKMGKALFGSKIGFTLVKILAIVAIPAGIITYNYFTDNTNTSPTEKTKLEVPTDKEQVAINEQNTSENINEQEPNNNNVKPLLESNTANKKILTKERNKSFPSNLIVKDIQTSVAKTTKEAETTNGDKKMGKEVDINKEVEEKPIVVSKENTERQSNFFDENDSIEETKQNKDEQNKGIDILIKMPGSFSPNNDGINDKYVVLIEGEKFYNLKIYSREEELLFESSDKLNTWDGIDPKSGQICTEGIYLAVLVYKSGEDVNFRTKRKVIKLIR